VQTDGDLATDSGLRSPQQLYLDWERSHWAAHDIDLRRDFDDWAALDDLQRTLLQFALASLMVAEERISTQFVGLVLAQDDEEEGSFLASQLVDEVRHMQFYARFQDEVISDPASIGSHVARARELLEAPFREIFDVALVGAHERLCREPRSLEAKVDFVTIYHMVLEGTLGVTTSHFLLGYLRSRRVLPGFARGYGLIAADEGRHIAYGTQFLRGAVARDPEMSTTVRTRLERLMPSVRQSLSPAGAEEILGVKEGALLSHGMGALDRRLGKIGVRL
jgi:ribonucleoside-diphosphate reductase beta chain